MIDNPRGKQTMAPSEVNVSYRHVLMKHRQVSFPDRILPPAVFGGSVVLQRRQVNGFYLVELGIINDEAQVKCQTRSRE